MSILDLFRTTNEMGEDESIPEKPDDAGERKSNVEEYTVYEIELEYRNGDTETIDKAFGYSRGGTNFEYASEVVGKLSWYSDKVYQDRKWDAVAHYETLNREPIVNEVGTVEVELSWTQEYREENRYDGTFKKWEGRATDITTEELE